MDRVPRAVTAAAGFAELRAAKALSKAPVQVVVIDRSNHHLFRPLLYQVATGSRTCAEIATLLRRTLRDQPNAEVTFGDVTSVDFSGKRLSLVDGQASYDYLVLAAGATHCYFGRDEWTRLAPGSKTLEDAMEIRRRVLSDFEIPERETDATRPLASMTFVVIGGGPTGVELSGALAEFAGWTLAHEFRHIHPAQPASSWRAAPGSSPHSSSRCRPAHGANWRRSGSTSEPAEVKDVDDDGVSIGAERIEARTVLWAAGVAASPLSGSLGVPLDKAGRVVGEPDLTIPGRDDVYVIGDLAHFEQNGALVPGVAPAAMQEGCHAAANILRRLRGELPEPFRYTDKGMLATIGRSRAVTHIGRLEASGLFAWLTWLFVHIMFLIGFRNRLIVMIQWAWSFLTYDRGARVLIQRVRGALADDLPTGRQAASAPATFDSSSGRVRRDT
jgi:NADH dehydrogenase